MWTRSWWVRPVCGTSRRKENASLCAGCLERRLEAIGETIAYGRRGDSLHYRIRAGLAEPGSGMDPI